MIDALAGVEANGPFRMRVESLDLHLQFVGTSPIVVAFQHRHVLPAAAAEGADEIRVGAAIATGEL